MPTTTVLGPGESSSRERRPEQVAAQPLEALPIGGFDAHTGMERVAVVAGAPRRHGHLLAAEGLHLPDGTPRSDRETALDRGSLQNRLDVGVVRLLDGIVSCEPLAREDGLARFPRSRPPVPRRLRCAA
jgi:hypothetical protein